MRPVLIIRAEPGASETAGRARRFGLDPIVAPLFHARPLDWQPPAALHFDAIMLTSAQAPRHAGEALAAYLHLPCYAVGDATAQAARQAGFADIHSGAGDGAALIERIAGDGVDRALHLCGHDRKSYAHPAVSLSECAVYRIESAETLSEAATQALRSAVPVLVHSARAAAHFARICDAAGIARETVRLAAISREVAEAAGPGWADVAAAERPRDEALLELAVKLCKTGAA